MSIPEAKIALCKCPKSHKIYGVRFEKVDNRHWKYTWAFPMNESAAKHEGYDATTINGFIEPDEDYPGCPYCGADHFIICSCGKLNCNAGMSNFKCEWCGVEAGLEAYGGGGFSAGGDR